MFVAATNQTRTFQKVRTSRAFTLVEASIVIAVVGILAAVSVVGFKAIQNSTSADRGKTELRQAAASLASYQQSRGTFPLDSASLARLEPKITFMPGTAATKPGEIALGTGTRNGVTILGLATISKTGDCLTMTQPPLSNDSIAPATSKFTPTATATCTGATALTKSTKEW